MGAVVGAGPHALEHPLIELHRWASDMMPGSKQDMYMKVRMDGAVENMVSPRVPKFVGKYCPEFVRKLMADFEIAPDLSLADCDVLCHPGGKSILETIQAKLKLEDRQLNPSWAVLQDHGNISGATNLMVADRWRRESEGSEWGIGLSFGPGLGTEGVILRRCSKPPTRPHPRTISEGSNGSTVHQDGTELMSNGARLYEFTPPFEKVQHHGSLEFFWNTGWL